MPPQEFHSVSQQMQFGDVRKKSDDVNNRAHLSCNLTPIGDICKSILNAILSFIHITATTVNGLPAIVVIYDPNGGSVSGGGWINSPAGAFTPIPSLAGVATFGFVSRYQNGANVPTGATEFQFQAGNLNFKSTSYEWLVISGGKKAQYKGTGTINGSGNFRFMLTAVDGDQPGGDGVDKLRI